jgi:CubicO group peptidase (beta-lactamase class C family)
MVCAVLEHQGTLDPAKPAAHYIEELKHTAYKDTTVRQLLDMQAAVKFDEDYLATEGPIIEYRKATGWNPLQEGEQPSDLRTFLQTLTEVSGKNGGDFSYTSPTLT